MHNPVLRWLGLAFVLCFCLSPFAFSDDSLTAIDILLEPDEAMRVQARADNARLRENDPESFALDGTHIPHISVLQCYVYTRDLDKVFAAVKQVTQAQSFVGTELTTTGYFYIPWQGQELAGINIALTSELRSYQRAIMDAVQPFTAKNGTSEAFVPNDDGSPVGEAIIRYVSSFDSQHTGEHYSPHITIGIGREDFLRKMTTAAPYTPITFKAMRVGVYHLGDFGAARKKLA